MISFRLKEDDFEIIPNGGIDFYYQDFFNLDFSICTKSNRHQCSGYKLSKLDRVILIKYIIFVPLFHKLENQQKPRKPDFRNRQKPDPSPPRLSKS